MSISSVSTANNGASSSSSASSSTSRNTLGENDFLKLLITQLQNQDPLQPVDNQAFIAQLAQFSSLESLQSLGDRLDTLLLAQAASNQMSAAALVGKQVIYRTDSVTLSSAGQAASIQAELSNSADTVTAAVTDSSGKTVRVLTLGAQSAGTVAVNWDGCDSAGNALPAGTYQIKVTATRKDNGAVTVVQRARGVVQGVSYQNGAPQLVVGADHVNLSDVVEIDQLSTTGA
jgi:flagellar basal-body rod modification protein FlgD